MRMCIWINKSNDSTFINISNEINNEECFCSIAQFLEKKTCLILTISSLSKDNGASCNTLLNI